jgi:hypothetical protein
LRHAQLTIFSSKTSPTTLFGAVWSIEPLICNGQVRVGTTVCYTIQQFSCRRLNSCPLNFWFQLQGNFINAALLDKPAVAHQQ